MTVLTVLLSVSFFSIIGLGLYLTLHPQKLMPNIPSWVKSSVIVNLAFFALGVAGLLFVGLNETMAAAETVAETREISIGLGLALIGVGLPTGLATIGAGIAVSSVGSASLAVITEKPELFGRTLVYLGLAEGIAIYGLVVSILLLGKI